MANSKLTSDGFSRFPHTMVQETDHCVEGWFYEEPKGFSVCARLLPNGPTAMFYIPRRAILTYVRHLEAAASRSNSEGGSK